MVIGGNTGKIGLALGSGAARGWAHIGVIRALLAAGIVPDIVCGSSVGAIVGAAYAAGHLDRFEHWVHHLDRGRVLRNLDLSFRGGLLKGAQFFSFMSPELPDQDIASLPKAFAAVATDLQTGREVWLRDGSLHDALRASVALPGLITPAVRDGRWLVDGGLVNPVPVSLCRAMGAETVVAVDLNTTLLNNPKRASALVEEAGPPEAPPDEGSESLERVGQGDATSAETSDLRASIESWASELRARIGGKNSTTPVAQPSLYEVLANSLNIMQVRITRSRMAGDPPDLLITPRLSDFALLDLDRGEEAIEEGRRAADLALMLAAQAEHG